MTTTFTVIILSIDHEPNLSRRNETSRLSQGFYKMSGGLNKTQKGRVKMFDFWK